MIEQLESSYQQLQFKYAFIKVACDAWLNGDYAKIDPTLINIYEGKKDQALQDAHAANFNRGVRDYLALYQTLIPATSAARQLTDFEHGQLTMAFHDVNPMPTDLVKYLAELAERCTEYDKMLEAHLKNGAAHLKKVQDRTDIDDRNKGKILKSYNKATSKLPVIEFAKMDTEAVRIKRTATWQIMARDHIQNAMIAIRLLEQSFGYYGPGAINKDWTDTATMIQHVNSGLPVALENIHLHNLYAFRHIMLLTAFPPSFPHPARTRLS